MSPARAEKLTIAIIDWQGRRSTLNGYGVSSAVNAIFFKISAIFEGALANRLAGGELSPICALRPRMASAIKSCAMSPKALNGGTKPVRRGHHFRSQEAFKWERVSLSATSRTSTLARLATLTTARRL
ncbi:hypothetical protein HNP83_006156 [Rhizobium leguminosarum]|nr:hypothetical protein [Rhizobium leguminosarum]